MSPTSCSINEPHLNKFYICEEDSLVFNEIIITKGEPFKQLIASPKNKYFINTAELLLLLLIWIPDAELVEGQHCC